MIADTFNPGDVVQYVKCYKSNPDRDYDYAAVRVAGGMWYTTGGLKLTWQHLMEEIERDNLYQWNMWKVKEWEEIVNE